MEIYRVKTRTEYWILFKLLKLPVIFFGTYYGLLLTISILSTGRHGRPVFWAEYSQVVFNTLWWISGAILAYYLYSKLKHSEIDSLTFNDKAERLGITFRNYLFHFKFSRSYPYSGLSVTFRQDKDFINGEYEHVEFFTNRKRVAMISGSSVDWHKMPNTIYKIKYKITEIENHHKLDKARNRAN